jgi:hypothetical protein
MKPLAPLGPSFELNGAGNNNIDSRNFFIYLGRIGQPKRLANLDGNIL